MAAKRRPLVVGLTGSMREESKTRIAVETALEAARQAGARTEHLDLRSMELPPLYATDGQVDDAKTLRETIEAADSVLLGTPNYHGSYSGVLKNALDYCGREEFDGTTVGLIEVAGGGYPGPALAHLRQVCRVLNAWTLPIEVAIPRSRETVTADGVVDEDIADRLRQLGEALAQYGGVEEFDATAAESALRA